MADKFFSRIPCIRLAGPTICDQLVEFVKYIPKQQKQTQDVQVLKYILLQRVKNNS